MRRALFLAALVLAGPALAQNVLRMSDGRVLLPPTLTTSATGGGGTTGTTALTLVDFAGVTQGTDGKALQQVLQRAPGLTTRDVPLAFSYAGTAPASIQGRVIKRVGGATVKDWTALTGLVATGGNGSGVLAAVPQGSDFVLQIREGVTQPTSGPLFSSTAQRWGIGVVVWFTGQSNMNNTLGGTDTVAVPGYSSEDAAWSANAYAAILYDRAGFHQPSNGNPAKGPSGSCDSANNTLTANVWRAMRLIAGGLNAKYGYDVPVAVVSCAQNATAIEEFTGPSGQVYQYMVAGSGHSATASPPTFGFSTPGPWGVGQDFEVVAFHQGEANAGDTQATYQTKLGTFYASLRTFTGRSTTTLHFVPMVIGTLAVSVGAGVENVRSAQQAWVAAGQGSGVELGGTTIDLSRVPPGGGAADDYHFTQPALQRRSMNRVVQAILHTLGAAPYGARGPVLGTLTRSGNVGTWTVSQDAGTGLQGAAGSTGISGFACNAASDFSGAAITTTAAIVSGSVQLTWPGGTTYPIYCKYLGAQIGTAASSAPDITNPVYDNTVYPRYTGQTGTNEDSEGLGFPLLPTVTAVVVP